jgi:hypothetical protein
MLSYSNVIVPHHFRLTVLVKSLFFKIGTDLKNIDAGLQFTQSLDKALLNQITQIFLQRVNRLGGQAAYQVTDFGASYWLRLE